MTHSELTPDTLVARKDGVLASQLDDETVLLDIDAGNYYAYDAVGGRIWELLGQPCTVATLCGELTQQFAVDPARCEREVLDFLRELSAHGLLRSGPAAAGV